MGLIGGFFRAGGARAVGEAVGGVAEVFVGNRADRDAAAAQQVVASVSQFGGEFAQAAPTRFDSFVNGLNRLPRPMLALGTFGLFGYAMAEPEGFSVRMQGLGFVPEPLWWLLGAIVSFYFGARELHHQRTRGTRVVTEVAGAARAQAAPAETGTVTVAETPAPVERAEGLAASDPDYNPAVEEWRRRRA
jgi:hypothetical protein